MEAANVSSRGPMVRALIPAHIYGSVKVEIQLCHAGFFCVDFFPNLMFLSGAAMHPSDSMNI